jgi:hypothetical protein
MKRDVSGIRARDPQVQLCCDSDWALNYACRVRCMTEIREDPGSQEIPTGLKQLRAWRCYVKFPLWEYIGVPTGIIIGFATLWKVTAPPIGVELPQIPVFGTRTASYATSHNSWADN